MADHSGAGIDPPGRTVTLGISADLHDAAACVVVDGEIVAAAEEERFTRRKHEPAMPRHAIDWCLEEAGVGPGDLSRVAFHDKPFTTYERILVTHARTGPAGFRSLAPAVATWSRSKLWVRARIERILREHGHRDVPLAFAEHHLSHAAAAFLPSPFEEAAILTVDGVGEWATSSIGVGRDGSVTLSKELRFPDSVGLLYSTVTAHCGFEVNDGEYKVMGLAPYGDPRFADVIRDRVAHLADDGSIRLDQRWFAYQAGRRMGHRRLAELFDGPPRSPDEPLTQREADLAASIQVVLEDVMLAMARHAHEVTGASRLCLAGGVALNCVANARLLRDGPFEDLWIQPAAGDSGSAIGAALWAHHELDGVARTVRPDDAMSGCLLGPRYEHSEVRGWLDRIGVPYQEEVDDDTLYRTVAAALDDGRTVGWFRGRMEFGPRALGARSILADPRRPDAVTHINAAVKRREGFRPLAPAVLEESASDWFDLDRPSPYMLRTAPVAPSRFVASNGDHDATGSDAPFAERLATRRTTIPACTHVDGSARVQTVSRHRHPELWGLLRAFEDRTGCPVLLNTSFNGRNEPIVRTPGDALRCFAATDLDMVVIEGCIVRRDDLGDGSAVAGEGPS